MPWPWGPGRAALGRRSPGERSRRVGAPCQHPPPAAPAGSKGLHASALLHVNRPEQNTGREAPSSPTRPAHPLPISCRCCPDVGLVKAVTRREDVPPGFPRCPSDLPSDPFPGICRDPVHRTPTACRPEPHWGPQTQDEGLPGGGSSRGGGRQAGSSKAGPHSSVDRGRPQHILVRGSNQD